MDCNLLKCSNKLYQTPNSNGNACFNPSLTRGPKAPSELTLSWTSTGGLDYTLWRLYTALRLLYTNTGGFRPIVFKMARGLKDGGKSSIYPTYPINVNRIIAYCVQPMAIQAKHRRKGKKNHFPQHQRFNDKLQSIKWLLQSVCWGCGNLGGLILDCFIGCGCDTGQAYSRSCAVIK